MPLFQTRGTGRMDPFSPDPMKYASLSSSRCSLRHRTDGRALTTYHARSWPTSFRLLLRALVACIRCHGVGLRRRHKRHEESLPSLDTRWRRHLHPSLAPARPKGGATAHKLDREALPSCDAGGALDCDEWRIDRPVQPCYHPAERKDHRSDHASSELTRLQRELHDVNKIIGQSKQRVPHRRCKWQAPGAPSDSGKIVAADEAEHLLRGAAPIILIDSAIVDRHECGEAMDIKTIRKHLLCLSVHSR
eukprot:CAMPEP_0115857610 /NCGR_PEP_ID=MMETSP0287-20121206/15663_1 /TAXON_ID=412157 /ORGANISM="Chrysochromulina rotalis, Strain UIO044" /LENGTH=247 /DNA_ID=CAMNT_0003311833 /DNA_START=75 /DNA_END=818 /DNA_ORIENTATION=-